MQQVTPKILGIETTQSTQNMICNIAVLVCLGMVFYLVMKHIFGYDITTAFTATDSSSTTATTSA